jgi:hypothetical protein
MPAPLLPKQHLQLPLPPLVANQPLLLVLRIKVPKMAWIMLNIVMVFMLVLVMGCIFLGAYSLVLNATVTNG